jgi:predicted amidophosphoribosyltransferase
MGNETYSINASGEGAFRFQALRAGTWRVRAEAKGFVGAEVSALVVAGEERRVQLVIEKDMLPWILAGAIAAAVLVALAVVAVRFASKKCPRCRQKLPRKANACPACGHVLRQKSRLDMQREARVAQEAETRRQQRAAAASVAQRKKAQKPLPAQPPAPAAAAAPPPLAAQKPRPTNCFACGSAVGADESWCPKCGQAVGAAETVDECKRCGGAVLDGVCINCGSAVPEVDESATPEGAPCPRCGTPFAPGANFCDRCGSAGAQSGAIGSVQPPERPGTPAPVGPPRPPDAATAAPPAEGMVHCATCGTQVPKDMVICDVCGETMRR